MASHKYVILVLLHLSSSYSIYNGDECDATNYKFVVQIIGHKKNGRLVKCTGTLVQLDKVLTAAHCVTKFRRSIFAEPKVILHTDKGLVSIGTKKIYIHEKYEEKDLQYDVAVLILEDYFPSTQATIIKLPHFQNFEECQKGEFLGFGNTNFRHTRGVPEPPQKNLHCINLPVMSNENCSLLRRLDKTKTFFCTFAGFSRAGGGCLGDSGGPFLCDGVQYGIASVNFGCGVLGEPTYFTRIDKTLDFIERCGRDSNVSIEKNVLIFYLLFISMRIFVL